MSALARWLPAASARPKRSPIGIHLGDDAIHLVQLRQTASGITEVAAAITQAYSLPRDEMLKDPASLRTLLRQGLRGGTGQR